MPRPKPQPTPARTRPPKRPAATSTEPLTQSNVVLWTNVLALMKHAYGKENLSRLARECGMSPANATRIKEQRTSIGIEVIEKVAGAFQMQSWELLVPGLDPINRPVLRVPSEGERKLYENAKKASEALVDFLDQANTRPGELRD